MSNSNGRTNSSNGKATMIICSIILAIIVGVIIYIIIDKSTDKDDDGHHGNHHWYPPKCNTSRGYIWSQRFRRCVRGYYK